MPHSSQPIRPPKHQQGSVLSTVFWVVSVLALVAFAVWVFYLNTVIISKFENRRWNIPATVYSRPLELYPNAPVSSQDLENWLKLLNYTKNKATQGGYKVSSNTITIYTRGFDYGDGDIEAQQTIEVQFGGDKITKVRSSQPAKNGKLRLEPVNVGGIYPANNEDRQLLTKSTTPQSLVDALIATEDRGFYEHYGISLRGTARAVSATVSGKDLQGGSTITQQLIKNFYLNSERSLKRKITEAMMSVLIELHYDKDEILLAYLNEINLGQNGNRSVNGFAIASQFYFNKPLTELRTDQHALLVGIAKGASFYNPRKHPERATQRRNVVLHNMLITGKISQEEYDSAIKKPLDVVKTPTIAKSRFPDFLDTIGRELRTYYREEDLQNAGLRIISTLDPLAQAAADKAISGLAAKNLQTALVSANPTTGEIIAIVGSSTDFTGFNRAIDAKRQVGSLLKPAIYLTALQSGKYNLATNVSDASTTYKVGGQNWTPKNYGGNSHGNVPLSKALANSYNQAAVNVGMEFGVPTFKKQLAALGIKNEIPNYPSILLGAVDLSAMDVLGMYQVFASGGNKAPLHSIHSVIDETGKVLQSSAVRTQTRLSPEAAYLTNHAMQQVISSGTAKAANFNSSLKLAGKTGTTNNGRDAWFAGYSGNYVSVVWVGRDDNKAVGLVGGKDALPIWVDFMKRLKLTAVNLPKPDGVTWTWLDSGSGLLSEEGCHGAVWVPVITKFMPQYSGCANHLSYEPVGGQMMAYDDVVDTEQEYQEEYYPDESHQDVYEGEPVDSSGEGFIIDDSADTQYAQEP